MSRLLCCTIICTVIILTMCSFFEMHYSPNVSTIPLRGTEPFPHKLYLQRRTVILLLQTQYLTNQTQTSSIVLMDAFVSNETRGFLSPSHVVRMLFHLFLCIRFEVHNISFAAQGSYQHVLNVCIITLLVTALLALQCMLLNSLNDRMLILPKPLH